ncbi:MAG: DinB/UmuC family translesion DNA polymerase, partial [Planctomycetota bacterium]
TVTVKARFWNFKTVTRSKTLPLPTNLGPRLFATARELLDRVPPGPLRLLGVQVSNLEDVREPVQTELFGEPAEEPAADTRLARATEELDRLRKKYGRDVVMPATVLGVDQGRRSPR